MEEKKIIIYQSEDGQTKIDVSLENETVWLTTHQMALLFEKRSPTSAVMLSMFSRMVSLKERITCKKYTLQQAYCRHAFTLVPQQQRHTLRFYPIHLHLELFNPIELC